MRNLSLSYREYCTSDQVGGVSELYVRGPAILTYLSLGSTYIRGYSQLGS